MSDGTVGRSDPYKEKLQASREKTWDECDQVQKVERLRDALRRTHEMAQHGAETAGNAMDVATGHQHAGNGEVMVRPRIHGHGPFGGDNHPQGYRRFDPLA